MHRILTTLLSASVAAALAACGSSGDASPTSPGTPTPSPQTATINATPSLAFSPSTITVAPGGTVTFAFGSVGHSVQFDANPNAPADITGVNANTSITRTFATAGTYTFHCAIHPLMTGTVTVAATASDNTPPDNTGSY